MNKNKNRDLQDLLGLIKKADYTFNLINEGDKIAVGISGGKDSIVLFYALTLYQKFAIKKFEIVPITLDLGFKRFDPTSYINYFADLGYPLVVVDSRSVYKILEIQKEKQNTPLLSCSICSRMKKASINHAAKELGCNKVAFGHHNDDALETLFMNMISGSRLATFAPKMYLSNADITFIRPLILVDEATIRRVAIALELPLLGSGCPNDKKTRREDVKNMINEIYKQTPEAKTNFKNVLLNYQKVDLWADKIAYQTSTQLVISPLNSLKQASHAFYIRSKVFIEEQGVPVDDEFDINEQEYTSLVGYIDDKPVATLRYKVDEDKKTLYIGRFAVLKEYRNKGHGSTLLNFVENIVSKKIKPLSIKLSSQISALPFYEKHGYQKEGKIYKDAGIDHINVVKTRK